MEWAFFIRSGKFWAAEKRLILLPALSFSCPCSILAHSNCMNRVRSLLSMRGMLLGYSFEPRPVSSGPRPVSSYSFVWNELFFIRSSKFWDVENRLILLPALSFSCPPCSVLAHSNCMYRVRSFLSMRGMLLGYCFEPRPNSLALAISG